MLLVLRLWEFYSLQFLLFKTSSLHCDVKVTVVACWSEHCGHSFRALQFKYKQSMWAERSGPKIWWSGGGAWSGCGRKRWSGARNGNGAGSGLNRPLTARSSMTFYFTWLNNVYSLHWTVCILLFQSSLFYSSCTCLVTCSNLVQPFTYNPFQCILNKTQSISSTWTISNVNYCNIKISVNYSLHITRVHPMKVL